MAQYVTLPSNSSYEFFPNNKTSHFRVHLPRPLEFKGDHEVALAQLQCVRSWYNLAERACHIEIVRERTDALNPDLGPRHLKYYATLQAGTYNNAIDLVNAVNKAILTGLKTGYHNSGGTEPHPLDDVVFIRKEFFVYDPVSHKVTVKSENRDLIMEKNNNVSVGSDTFVFYMHPELLVRLGFTSLVPPDYKIGDFEKEFGSYDRGTHFRAHPRYSYLENTDCSDMSVDVNTGFNNIYVYSDVMQQINFVGDTLQSCLRVVPTAGSQGNEMVLYEPHNLHFFPLRSSQINDIEVQLRTDMGELVPFERGTTVLTLCIRRTRPFGA